MPNHPKTVLVSAGEASGDRYAALLVEELRRSWPDTHFFGCTGPRLREAGVETAVHSEELAVVGLVEVLRHLPRIWGEFQKLLRTVRHRKPSLAILTDSPDFHLRVAEKLAAQNIAVVYLVAPQVWAWRKGRLKTIRRLVDSLLCLFPFEEPFFRKNGVPAHYIGHPLTEIARPALDKAAFLAKYGIPPDRPLVAVLPGSRRGESLRHLPVLLETVRMLNGKSPMHFVLPASANTGSQFFRERIGASPIQVIDGDAWDAMAHADVTLAASGTVTVEAAVLGAPMVVFYRVSWWSWILGRMLVDIPFFSMVNLIAGKKIVLELIQGQMTARALSDEAVRLLENDGARQEMKRELAEVVSRLTLEGSVMSRAAAEVFRVWEKSVV